MAGKFILHIGSPKCGSTYLQRVMLENRSLLAKHGVSYPKPKDAHPGNGAEVGKLDAKSLTRLFDGKDTLVMSHEDLFAQGARMEGLGNLCRAQGVELRILVFLRPFSEFIYGDYSQYLKQNIDTYISAGTAYDGQSFEEFAVRRRGQITPCGWLKAWQKVSDQPLTLAHHRQIRPVLEELLGDIPLNWKIEKTASNPSLRVVDCEDIAGAIAGGVPKPKVMDMYKLAYAKVSLDDQGKSSERTKWLEALFKSQNDRIQEEFSFDNIRAA